MAFGKFTISRPHADQEGEVADIITLDVSTKKVRYQPAWPVRRVTSSQVSLVRYWQKMELLTAEGSYLHTVVKEDHLECARDVSSNCFHILCDQFSKDIIILRWQAYRTSTLTHKLCILRGCLPTQSCLSMCCVYFRVNRKFTLLSPVNCGLERQTPHLAISSKCMTRLRSCSRRVGTVQPFLLACKQRGCNYISQMSFD